MRFQHIMHEDVTLNNYSYRFILPMTDTYNFEYCMTIVEVQQTICITLMRVL